jgi:hypothetical protein
MDAVTRCHLIYSTILQVLTHFQLTDLSESLIQDLLWDLLLQGGFSDFPEEALIHHS